MSTSESRPDTPEKGRPGALRLVLPIVVLLAILAGAALLLAGGSSKPAPHGSAGTTTTVSFYGTPIVPPQPAPPLDTLRNYTGSRFSLAADRGKAVFVTFLYAHCPDVCPLIASDLHNAYAKITPAQRRHVDIVAVSVDPNGDTARTVAAFMHAHQLAGEGRYLLGSARLLVPVWKAWKVGSEKDVSRPDLIDHSALIYGISASGRLSTIYPASFEPEEIVHDVAPLLRR